MSQCNQSDKHNKVFSKKRLVPLVFFFIFPPAGIAILIYDLLQESKESLYCSTVHAPVPTGSSTVTVHNGFSSTQNDPLMFLKQKRKKAGSKEPPARFKPKRYLISV